MLTDWPRLALYPQVVDKILEDAAPSAFPLLTALFLEPGAPDDNDFTDVTKVRRTILVQIIQPHDPQFVSVAELLRNHITLAHHPLHVSEVAVSRAMSTW